MERRYPEVVGVRRTGWAALDRDPQRTGSNMSVPTAVNGDRRMPGASGRNIFYRRLFAGPARRSNEIAALAISNCA